MCEFILKRGPKKGQKCEKKPKKDSVFCSIHAKSSNTTQASSSTTTTQASSSSTTTQASSSTTTQQTTDYTISIPVDLFDKINQESLKEVCMSSVIDVLNLIKEQSKSNKKKFNISDIEE